MMKRKVYAVVDPRWWFVCCVVPGREMPFRRSLSKEGILNFAPVTSKRIKVKGSIRRLMLFPGYVFVFGDHYMKFLSLKNVKDLLGVMKMDDEVYRLAQKIVYELLLKQALGIFDYREAEGIVVGDLVDVFLDKDKKELVIQGVRVISMDKKCATIFAKNLVMKIKFGFLSESVHKDAHSSPP